MVSLREHKFGNQIIKGDIRLIGVENENEYNLNYKVKCKLFWNYTDKNYFMVYEYNSGLAFPLVLDFNPGFAKIQYNVEIFNPEFYPHENLEIARHWTDNNKIKLFYNFKGYLFVELLWETKKIRKVFFDLVDYKVDPYEKHFQKCISESHLH